MWNTYIQMRQRCCVGGACLTSDRQLRALNMSNITKQVKVMVVSRGVTWPSSNWMNRQEKLSNMSWWWLFCEMEVNPNRRGKSYLFWENPKCPQHNGGGCQYRTAQQIATDHSVGHFPWRLSHDVAIHGLHPQTKWNWKRMERWVHEEITCIPKQQQKYCV